VPADGAAGKSRRKQGSISFLKKRNKKLLSVPGARRCHACAYATRNEQKFLVLFFKKERLPGSTARRYLSSRASIA
jgi:hypothetical protein